MSTTKTTLLEQLKAGKITPEEYAEQMNALFEKQEEEAKRAKEEVKRAKEEAKRAQEELKVLSEENAQLKTNKPSSSTSLYDEMVAGYVEGYDVTYFVELCDLLLSKVLQFTKYEVTGIFNEKYADCTLHDVLDGFAATLKDKTFFPKKKKMKLTVGEVEYASYADYFQQYLVDIVAKADETPVADDDDLLA